MTKLQKGVGVTLFATFVDCLLVGLFVSLVNVVLFCSIHPSNLSCIYLNKQAKSTRVFDSTCNFLIPPCARTPCDPNRFTCHVKTYIGELGIMPLFFQIIWGLSILLDVISTCIKNFHMVAISFLVESLAT